MRTFRQMGGALSTHGTAGTAVGIRMELREMGLYSVDWIDVAQDGVSGGLL
jgi:hypothetical protein